jgi:hypothetical protein
MAARRRTRRRTRRRNRRKSRRQRGGGCGCGLSSGGSGQLKGGSKLSVGPLNMKVMPPPRTTQSDIPRPSAKKGGYIKKKRRRRSMCARLTNKACKSKRYKKRCKTTRRKKRGSKGRKSHCRSRKNRYAKRSRRKRKQKGGGLLRDIGLGDAMQGYYSGVEMVDNARNRWAGKKYETPSDVIKQPKMMRTPEAQYKIPNVPDYYNKASVQAAKHMLK